MCTDREPPRSEAERRLSPDEWVGLLPTDWQCPICGYFNRRESCTECATPRPERTDQGGR